LQVRLEKLQNKLPQAGLDGLLIGNRENRLYMSGFTGSEGKLLVTREGAFLCVDFRYVEQAREQAPGWEIVEYQRPYTATLSRLITGLGLQKVGFEKEYLSYQGYQSLLDNIPGIKWLPVAGLVESLRLQKDEAEIESIKRASRLDDLAFGHIVEYLGPGLREREVALELEVFARRQGGEGASFDIIVASGPRAALPHGVASDKLLQAGELVIMDFGTIVDSYHSDFTRTVIIGEPSAKQRKVYEVVREAQETALAAVAPGRSAGEIDALARKVIADRGYGPYFGHGVGHGVGLNIHEGPQLSPGAETVLLPGMVITIEPGIYIPGWGGVRIEDLLLVTETGCEVFTQSSRELIKI